MNKRKRSIIWDLARNEFQQLVNECQSLADILRKFNLHVGAGNYKTLKKRIKEDNINIEHIPLGINSNKNRKLNTAFLDKKSIPLEAILVVNSTYNHGNNLKRRLFAKDLLINKCYECGQLPEWNGKPLTLQLDHINGNHCDNRLENLRILCPHCHTQTETYNGRHNKIKSRCIECNKKISSGHIRCLDCNSVHHSNKFLNKNTKIEWPSNDELINMVREKNFLQVAKFLGVSDNTIRKRLKRRHLLHLIK